jgi:hypothetical protein
MCSAVKSDSTLHFYGNQGHWGFPSFPVFDSFYLLTYEFCLSLWKIARCSVILLLPLFLHTCVYSAFVLLLLLHCFIVIPVLLLCCECISSPYCNIPSDLCTLFCLVIISTLFFYTCTVAMLCIHIITLL